MKCPSCGSQNISGSDECGSCGGDLSALDGVIPKSKIERVLMSDPIASVHPKKPIVIGKETTVQEAVTKMNEAKVGCLLVGDDKNMEGILTERDIVLKVLVLGADMEQTTVSSIMTSKAESLASEDSLAYAVNRMSVGGYRHIPILKDQAPVGIVSIRDVLKHLAKLFH